jgi:hypothetical protein
MDVVELAANMSEAEGERHGAAGARRLHEAVVAGITIHLQHAGKASEDFFGALALAILGKDVKRRGVWTPIGVARR